MHEEEYNKRQPTHTYQQPLIPTAAPVPGSIFNRHGGSKSNRRGHEEDEGDMLPTGGWGESAIKNFGGQMKAYSHRKDIVGWLRESFDAGAIRVETQPAAARHRPNIDLTRRVISRSGNHECADAAGGRPLPSLSIESPMRWLAVLITVSSALILTGLA